MPKSNTHRRRSFLGFFCCHRPRIVSDSEPQLTEDTQPNVNAIVPAVESLSTSILREAGQAFRALLLEKSLSEKDRQVLFVYLHGLRVAQDGAQLFHTAVDFMCQTRQFLHINASSLAFFHELSQNNQKSYQDLMSRIAQRAPGILLKHHHLDAVIDVFQAQRQLAANAQQRVDDFASHIDIESVISNIQQAHFPEIVTQSIEENLLHHTLKHAAEIKVRAKCVIDKLRLLDVVSHNFLRKLTKFAIEGHDLRQKNPRGYPTVELATAAQLEAWLFKELGLNESSNENKILRDYIHLVLHKIIVLGTTMIFSHESTLDLSELFHWIEAAAEEAGIETCDATNRMLMQKLDLIALLTGVCDKTPSALYEVVSQQAKLPATNSLARLKAFYPDSVLDDFMTDDGHFRSYFSMAYREENQQAFMMGLVPHLCMRAELAAAKKNDPMATQSEKKLAEKAIVFIRFVDECQNRFAKIDSEEEMPSVALQAYFEHEFIAQNMDRYVDELFFSMLNAEIQFSQSQVNSLLFVKKRLIQWGYLNSTDNDSFINPDAPAIDALNLAALGAFYQNLDSERRMQLSRELILNVVMQAGAAYLVEPSLEPLSEPPSPVRAASFSGQHTEMYKATQPIGSGMSTLPLSMGAR